MQNTITLAGTKERERTAPYLDPEAEADRLTAGGCYTERGIARKVRLERARLLELDETAFPSEATEYIFRAWFQQLVESARLSKLQAAILGLSAEGWTARQVSRQFGMKRAKVRWHLSMARKKLACGGSPYDGLWGVYWQEVHRYIYRKRG